MHNTTQFTTQNQTRSLHWKGTFNPKMTSQQRAADFHTMEASELLELMQISDTRPGMLHSFPGVPGKWFLFGGHLETPAASLQAISSQPDVKEGITVVFFSFQNCLQNSCPEEFRVSKISCVGFWCACLVWLEM